MIRVIAYATGAIAGWSIFLLASSVTTSERQVPTENVVRIRLTRVEKSPWIVSREVGKDECGDTDPLGPCPSTILHVRNPLGLPVIVTLSCGLDLEKPSFEMGPSSAARVEVSAAIPGGPLCAIDSWRAK